MGQDRLELRKLNILIDLDNEVQPINTNLEMMLNMKDASHFRIKN